MKYPLLSVTLPINLSNNNSGQTRHWRKSHTDRKKFERMLRRLRLVRTPFSVPVLLHVTRVLGKGQRYWDSDSVGRGNSKQIIDACTACGWWTDDSYKYIQHTAFFQDGGRRKDGPAVLIEVFS